MFTCVAFFMLSVAICLCYTYDLAHHHNYEETLQILEDVSRKCSNITRIYSIGESIEKRKLYVIEFSNNVGTHETGKPDFKYIGNMHGNEVVSKEMLLKLTDYLCEQYNTGNSTIRWLVDNTHIHIMPTMNPDGWHTASLAQTKHNSTNLWLNGRANAMGVDLNRAFPNLNKIMYMNERYPQAANNHIENLNVALAQTTKKAPEAKAVMRWLFAVPFVLSANLHGGDYVANYPYDLTRTGELHHYTKCPDDGTFRYLAESYSLQHTVMSKPHPPCDMVGDDLFYENDGITNGGKWYSVAGGMQDFNYLATNCFEITLELGCKKFPPAEELPRFWVENKDALINYIFQSHIGVKGIVRDEAGQPIPGASISVYNITGRKYIKHDVTTWKDGGYNRLLIDGPYAIEAQAPGYNPVIKCRVVTNNNKHEALIVDFTLSKEGQGRRGEAQGLQQECRDLLEYTQVIDYDAPQDYELLEGLLRRVKAYINHQNEE